MATTTVIGNVVTAVTNNIAKIKTAIGNATTSAAGLMTTAQVTKLNGIATGATKNTIDSALSTTSTNAVQNKVVTAQINTLNSSLAENIQTCTTITTAGLHSSCVCDVVSTVIRKSASGHYIVMSSVRAMQTVSTSDLTTTYSWLSIAALLKPIMTTLSVSNVTVKNAYYPLEGDIISDKGYGLYVRTNTDNIAIGRYYTTTFSKGEWPLSAIKANVSCAFTFIAEVY